MGNAQIGRTKLWYIKRGKSCNNEKQQKRQEFSEVIKKA